MRTIGALGRMVSAGLLMLAGCAGEPSVAGRSPSADGWRSLFDGGSLAGWRISDFPGHGDVRVKNGLITLDQGEASTGVTYAGDIPRTGYELEVEARRVRGPDFFCGLTFPVGPDACSLIPGGWNNCLVGISCVDGQDASDNGTTRPILLSTGRWYRFRVRVTPGRVEAWIDDDRVVDLSTAGKKIAVRPDIEESLPLGVAAWRTTAEIKSIRIRKVAP